MSTIFRNATLATPTTRVEGRYLLVSDAGMIEEIGRDDGKARRASQSFDLKGSILAPGFIDMHRHGGYGVNFGPSDNLAEELDHFSRQVPVEGVTGYLCSVAAPDTDSLIRAINDHVSAFRKWESGAEPLGIHLEGPYLNRDEKRGAFNPDWLRDPSSDEAKLLINAGGGWIRQITIDPELPRAHEVASLFAEAGILVAMGHTNAVFGAASRALSGGFNHVTHTFNCLRGIHHREPGAAGAVLASDSVTAELIPDLYHVHPGAMRIMLRCLGSNRIVLITDAIAGSGMEDGEYDLVGYTVHVKDGEARLEDGTIAGCTTPLNRCVHNVINHVGAPILDAVKMATLNPSQLIGVSDRLGRLAVGMDASLVVLNEEMDVSLVMVKGDVVHESW